MIRLLRRLSDFLEASNLVVTGVFLGEMLMKLAVYGWTVYWSDFFNRSIRSTKTKQ